MDEWLWAPEDQGSMSLWATEVVRRRVPAVLEKHEQEALESTCCQACGKGTDEEVLLLCENCELGWHTFCLCPPLPGVPEGLWLCAGCVVQEDIDSSEEEDGEGEEMDEEEDSAPLGTASDGLFRPLFVACPDARCGACGGAAAAGRFVLDAAQAALPPRQTPPLSPKGRWLCERCAWPGIEAVWAVQSAAAREAVLVPVSEEPQQPQKKRKRAGRFGPCRDLVLALAMERTGALERMQLPWRVTQREYFPQMAPRQLLRRYTWVQRRGATDNPLVQLFRLRADLKRKRKEEERAALSPVVMDKTRERVEALLRPLRTVEWVGTTCAGCAQPVCGTLVWCEECGLNYCAKCSAVDPLGHGLAHWSGCAEPCSACSAPGVLCNTNRVVYCEACLDADALEAVAKQFATKHKAPTPKDVRVLSKSLRISVAELHALIDRVWDAWNHEK
jgi:hypothetical protein